MDGALAVTRGVLAILAAIALLAPAARADTFPLYGFGDDPLEPGVLAAAGDIDSQAIALARRVDGVVAFAHGNRVFWIHHGRVLRVPVPVAGGVGSDLAFAPDGTLLVASCPLLDPGPAVVFRAAPGMAPAVVAGRIGRAGTSGDGGPATAARLRCAERIAVDRDGGILIADPLARRVRRVDPAGTIDTVAGTGRRGSSGDGGPALQARFEWPGAVAALPDGGFAIADLGSDGESGSIRVVDAAGMVSTRARTGATGIAVEPDGSLLMVDWRAQDSVVLRLAPDGAESVAVDHRDDLVPALEGNPLVGRVLPGRQIFEDSFIQTDAVAPTPDGGMLVAADFGISYVAPERPELLAVAIRRETFRPRRRLSVAIAITKAARVTVEAWRGDRIRAATALDVPAGESQVPVPQDLPGGEYRVRVLAEDAGQIVTDDAAVLVGTRLPRAYARTAIERHLASVAGVAEPRRCRRRGPRRVDCAIRERGRRIGVAAVRLRDDGTIRLSGRRRG